MKQKAKHPFFRGNLILLIILISLARNTGQTIQEIKELYAPNPTANDCFGDDVYISGEVLAIEAGISVNNNKAVCVFYKNQGGVDNWGHIKTIYSPDSPDDENFGNRMSLSNDYLLISDPGDFVNKAYLFQKDAGGINNWGLIKTFHEEYQPEVNSFAFDVSIDDDNIAISDPYSNSNEGIVYIYNKNEGGQNNWGLVKTIFSHLPPLGHPAYLGQTLDMNGDNLIVNGGNIRAIIYNKDRGGVNNWGVVNDIQPPDYSGVVFWKGGNYKIFGDYAILTGVNRPLNSERYIYVYKRNSLNISWDYLTTLNIQESEATTFSTEYIYADIYDDFITIKNTSISFSYGKGALYLFYKNQGGIDNWGQIDKLTQSESRENIGINQALCMSDTYIVTGNDGARYWDEENQIYLQSAGKVNIFTSSYLNSNTISINDEQIIEGETGNTYASFTVSLNNSSSQAITVNYSTSDGTATTSNNDYVSTSGTLTIQPGATSETVSVTINGDTDIEPDETFYVNLSNPVNATIADGQGVGTIVDDDDDTSGHIALSHWPFNSCSGDFVEDITGANDGTLAGSQNWDEGYSSQSHYFDGEGTYVRVPGDGSLYTPWDNFAVSLWFKSGEDFTSQPTHSGVLVSKPSNYELRLTKFGAYQRLSFSLFIYQPDGSGEFVTVYGGTYAPGKNWLSPCINDNEWHHAAATYDGAELKMYLDGELIQSKPATGEIGHAGHPGVNGANVYFGCSNPLNAQWSDYYLGWIDEISIYNVSLTEQEIADLASTISNPMSCGTKKSFDKMKGADGQNALFQLSPNPVDNYLTLNSLSLGNAKNISIEISNMFGQVVYNEDNIQTGYQIPISHLITGRYSCTIRYLDNIQVIPFMKR